LFNFTLESSEPLPDFPELGLDGFQNLYVDGSGGGVVSGKIVAHLRPGAPLPPSELSLFDIDKSHNTGGRTLTTNGTSFSVKLSNDWFVRLGKTDPSSPSDKSLILHVPRDLSVNLNVLSSLTTMDLEGGVSCDLSWQMANNSPTLYRNDDPTSKVEILLQQLREGSFGFLISSIGGIRICAPSPKSSPSPSPSPSPSADNLFDWKLFAALVDPYADPITSSERLINVFVSNKPTLNVLKGERARIMGWSVILCSITKLNLLKIHRLTPTTPNKDSLTILSPSMGSLLNHIMKLLYRAQDIIKSENINQLCDAIPIPNMARLFSLLLSSSDKLVDKLTPIIARVIAGDGLDQESVKLLLKKNLNGDWGGYEKFQSEIDRAIKFAALALGPVEAPSLYVEHNLDPLANNPLYSQSFTQIPTAATIYATLLSNSNKPLEKKFTKILTHVAPYLTFQQIDYILEIRSDPFLDWGSLENTHNEDYRRIKYIHSVKKKVKEIGENYGGLSFLPQSFLVSIFLGEATRGSLSTLSAPATSVSCDGHGSDDYDSDSDDDERDRRRKMKKVQSSINLVPPPSPNRRRALSTSENDLLRLSPSAQNSPGAGPGPRGGLPTKKFRLNSEDFSPHKHPKDNQYDLSTSLLGPTDVAILLQAGLTSPLQSSVVQLNQRILLNLISSQPNSFAVAVLGELSHGSSKGHSVGAGSARVLAGALMALLELDQSCFNSAKVIDTVALISSWTNMNIPRRSEYMAGGRWARESYYEALHTCSANILEEANEFYSLKNRLQRVSDNRKITEPNNFGGGEFARMEEKAQTLIKSADDRCALWLREERKNGKSDSNECIRAYRAASQICKELLECDELAFKVPWFKNFYRRNYDSLVILTIYNNVIENVDFVRPWLISTLKNSKQFYGVSSTKGAAKAKDRKAALDKIDEKMFSNPTKHSKVDLIDAIIELTFKEEGEREILKNDGMNYLLMDNEEGVKYEFSIIAAMGVITEGKNGTEIEKSFERIFEKRGIETIRADTGTARSFEFNALMIEEAINDCKTEHFGYIGYSQGCANAMHCESLMNSGTPKQQKKIKGLACRQLLFSAANGSLHGSCSDLKVSDEMATATTNSYSYNKQLQPPTSTSNP